MPTKYFSKKKNEWINYYKPREPGTRPKRAKNPRCGLRREINDMLYILTWSLITYNNNFCCFKLQQYRFE